MADTTTLINVFISSPSDVKTERNIIIEAIQALNDEPSVRERYVLKPLAYERNVPGEVGDSPQAVVDRYMREAGKADLYVGVLWARMGTPLKGDDGIEYQSGTEYEFRKAYAARISERGKPIMLQYRCMRAVPPTTDFEQAVKVQGFFKRFEGNGAEYKGLYKSYEALEEFRALIRKDILEVLAKHTFELNADVQPQPAAPVRRRVDHYQHIPLPSNYVERTSLLSELRKALIGDNAEVALTSAIKGTTQKNPTALHGMGGIGKSVMARALCDDPQVQAAFPDGILWATFGQTRNLVQELREWIKAFNETPDDKAELTGLKAHLSRLLAERACLLIVDDVWNKADAEAFRIGGIRCRTILTTRDEAIADELGAKVEPIPLMSEADAVSLLDLWAKDNLANVEYVTKAKLVNRVGRLALAVKLAGGLLARQTPDQWLNGFDVHKQLSRRPDSKNPHDSLETCFELSLGKLTVEERRLYAALAIFREGEPIVEQAVAKLWELYGDYRPSAVGELIDDLDARALLQVTNETHPRAFVLHDLLRDLMRDELGEQFKDAHRAIIEAYAKTKADDGWHSAPHDGYLYTHLAYHLRAMEKNEELYSLLTDSPTWMEAKYIACVGDRAYVDDLELAIKDFRDPLTAEQVIILAKLWTARQVVNSRASLYENIDLKTLVWMGKPKEAEAHARLRQEAKDKVKGLLAIFEAQQTHQQVDIQLLLQALDIAHVIEDTHSRATALSNIATALTQAGQPAQNIFDEALNVARVIEDTYSRATALSNIATALTQAGQPAQNIFDEALSTAETGEYDSQAYALSAIATAKAKAGYLDEALSIARMVEDDRSRAAALRDIAASMARVGRFDEAFITARAIEDATSRCVALSACAAALAQVGRFDEALIIARAIEDAASRSVALSACAAALAQVRQPAQTILNEALTTARTIDVIPSHAVTLQNIASALAQAGHLKEALSTAQSIENITFHAAALSSVASALAQAGHLKEALSTAQSIENITFRAAALSSVAAALAQAGHLEEALNTARTIEDTSARAIALSSVAAALAQAGQPAQTVFEEALNLARTIEDISARTIALSSVAAALAQARQPAQTVFEEALNLARTIERADSRTNALRVIATALAQATSFAKAFDCLGLHNLVEYLSIISGWNKGFEEMKAQLRLKILREAIRIVAWEIPQWKEIQAILIEVTE